MFTSAGSMILRFLRPTFDSGSYEMSAITTGKTRLNTTCFRNLKNKCLSRYERAGGGGIQKGYKVAAFLPISFIFSRVILWSYRSWAMGYGYFMLMER